MYLSRTPHIARILYPGLTWRMKPARNSIYLTFDDGPDPTVTPEALDLLDTYDARATFFCVGQKVQEHPELYGQLITRGHTTGNHTFNHLNGKKTDTESYVRNVEMASQLISSKLFRPPYGRITASQARQLKGKYKIIMWSVLPGDFDPGRTSEDVLSRAIRHTRSGSIVVLHDNAKFKAKMLHTLEGFLRHFKELGYRFEAIPEERI